MRSFLGSLCRRTLLLLALAAGALSLTLALSPARAHTSTEWSIDRKGGDMGPGKEMANAELCRGACDNNAACKAYTFVYKGAHSPKALCFLKSSVPPPLNNNCCISGVKNGWRSGPYYLKQTLGDMQIPLDPEKTHVCILTRVSGKFRGGGESVRVRVGADKRWHLEVDNHSDQGVAGTAYCFWKGGFSGNGPDRQVSPIFEAREKHGVRTWNGHTATFLAGINGHLRGGGEHARIVQSQDITRPSELGVGSAAGFLKAWAYSFFVGNAGAWPHDRKAAKFFGDEHKLDHVSLFLKWKDMAPTEEAMCYFTKLQGRFEGLGEWAEIVPFMDSNGVERWRLRAQAGSESEVFAAARCYKRDQR